MLSKEKLDEWRFLVTMTPFAELPEVSAGRKAEDFVKELINQNLRYKGSYCFVGKRVPSRKHRRRFEIDLIVLTKKQLHFLEVKNWSGELYSVGDRWIQRKRNGQEISHPNLTHYNAAKTDVMRAYLSSKGIQIAKNLISQKVIFMNNRLSLSADIQADPDVIPRPLIDHYLKSQRGTNVAERIIHAVIERCMETEKSRIVLDGLFNSMHSDEVSNISSAFSELRTWDLLGIYGGRVLQGDALSLYLNGKDIDLEHMDAGTKITLKWKRNRVFGLISLLLTENSLGKAKTQAGNVDVNPASDYIKFHIVGEKAPRLISLGQIDWFQRG